jgi:hypothetical protein
MKKVEPDDLEVGKTYFATNLGPPGIDPRVDLLWHHPVRRKRYTITVAGKKDIPQDDPNRARSKMPLELELTNMKEIRGNTDTHTHTLVGNAATDKAMYRNTPYIPDWFEWGDVNDVPKFYERKQMAIGVSHVVNKTKNKLTKGIRKLKKKLRSIDALKMKDSATLNEAQLQKLGTEDNLRHMLAVAEEEEKSSAVAGTSAFAGMPQDVRGLVESFGGRKPKRKTHRRKRSKTRRRKRSKTRRKRKSRRKRRKSRSRRK